MTALRFVRSALAIAVAALSLAACDGQNAALLTVNAPPGVSGFEATRLEILVRQHSTQVSDTVNVDPGKAITWPATVSFTFPSSVNGYIDVNVTAFGSGGIQVAEGASSGGPIKNGEVTPLAVTLAPSTASPPDMGSRD